DKRYNGMANGDDVAQGVAVDASGNVVVTGYSGSNPDFYTAKYAAATGALLWEKRYNGPANYDDQAQAVAVDSTGNVVVTGYSIGRGSGYDFYTAKYAAADGALLWGRRYNGPANGNDYAQAVVVDASGNVVVTGPPATIKYLTDGTMLWTIVAGTGFLAVDGGGNVM